MRSPRVLLSMPVWLVLVAATPTPTSPSASPTPSASPSPTHSPRPSPSPTPAPSPSPAPTPTPTLAFLTLDVTAGPPDTQITVNGGAFLANEQMTLYWDAVNKVAGGANADSSGNFTTHVKPFPGDTPGVHRLCASVQPYPCANFTLTAATSPSPGPSPTPSAPASPSASATASTTATASPTPIAATLNGFDVISRPPFVFLPIAGAIAILLALGYWIMSVVRRPKPLNVPASAVVHRATRPDYSAGFGTSPAAPPASPQRDTSAWADAFPTGARAARPAQPAPPTTIEPPPAGPQPSPTVDAAAPPDAPTEPPPPSAPAAEPQPPAGGVEAVPPPSGGVEAAPPPPADAEASPPVDWDVHAPHAPGAGPDEPLDLPEPGDDW